MNVRAARYPPASWNQTDRVETKFNRTNNYCESFNKTLSSVVGHAHPTIYNFLFAVHLEQASTEGKINSYRRGVQPPKKRYLEKDASLKHIDSTYLREQRCSVPGSSCRIVDFRRLTSAIAVYLIHIAVYLIL